MSTYKITKLGLILNTRPLHYHERFHEAFGELPWAVYDCPLMRAVPLGAMLPSPDTCDTVIFTSQLGVSMFLPDPRWFKKKVLAVGAATGQAAARAGYTDVLQTGETVDDLRRYVADSPPGLAFYPSADEVSADLSADFPGRVVRVPVYKMVPRPSLPKQFLDQAMKMGVVIPLFSQRSAVACADLMTKAGLTKKNSLMIAIGMSADVLADVKGPWQDQTISPRPTLSNMVVVTDMAISRLNT